MSFVFVWVFQMVGEDELSGFIPKTWLSITERFYPENAIQRDRIGGGSVMIWVKLVIMAKQTSSK
jgi:hypothetical protein